MTQRVNYNCAGAKERRISLETMEKFAEEHATEIEQKKAELKEGGWYE